MTHRVTGKGRQVRGGMVVVVVNAYYETTWQRNHTIYGNVAIFYATRRPPSRGA